MGHLILATVLAVAAVAPSEAPKLPGGQAAICVPPGLPPVAEWRPLQAAPIVISTVVGRLLVGVSAAYQLPSGRRVLAHWLEGEILTIDPAPDDPAVPLWVNLNRAEVEGPSVSILDVRRGPGCRWGQTGQGAT